MGQLNLKVDDELEREFRKVAADRFEARKGFIKKAVEEALSEWVRRNQRK
jgi:predicted transcriptional regulator